MANQKLDVNIIPDITTGQITDFEEAVTGIVQDDLALKQNLISVAILRDTAEPQTLNGGDPYTKRNINTEAFDPDGIVTLSSSQFTLGSGTYIIEWNAEAYSAASNQVHNSRLYDVTNAAAIIVGSTTRQTTGNCGQSVGFGYVTPTGNTAYRLESTVDTNGATGYTGGTGHTQVKITKIV